MVAPWFERRRPAALAMAFNGGAVGGVLFPPLWVALIAGLGFPGAAATKACHGSRVSPQPSAPAASRATPARVVPARPKRRCASGRKETSAAATRKCAVTAAETAETAHPCSASNVRR